MLDGSTLRWFREKNEGWDNISNNLAQVFISGLDLVHRVQILHLQIFLCKKKQDSS